MTLMLRGTSDPLLLAAAGREAVWSVDRDIPVTDMQRLDAVVAQSVAGPRLTAFLIAAFAAIALALGMIGVYGVVAYSVSQRTHEIGIRMSLGAQRSDVLRLVMGQGLALTAAGVVAGLAGSLAATRVLASLLFTVSTTDPAVFAIVTAALAAVAAFAIYIPTRRAMRVDPMIALRGE